MLIPRRLLTGTLLSLASGCANAQPPPPRQSLSAAPHESSALRASTFPGKTGGLLKAPSLPKGSVGGIAFRPFKGATAAQTVTFAHPFPAGVLPRGQGLTIGGNPAQVDVLQRHADGSVRHALVAVRVPPLSISEWAPGAVDVAPALSGTLFRLAATQLSPSRQAAALQSGLALPIR
jgi:hypothetical protein